MQPKKEYTTKHRTFGSTNLRQPKKFPQPLVVMVETLKRYAGSVTYFLVLFKLMIQYGSDSTIVAILTTI